MKQIDEILKQLDKENINLKEFSRICFTEGIPNEYSIRARCWRILLNYDSTSKNEREDRLNENREKYIHLIEDLLLKYHTKEDRVNPLTTELYPLSYNYFLDRQLLSFILNDCLRIRTGIPFFKAITKYPLSSFMNDSKIYSKLQPLSNFKNISVENYAFLSLTSKINENSFEIPAFEMNFMNDEPHYKVIQRMLFLYAKTNSQVKYVQGMNEIIAPLYYVLYFGAQGSNRPYVEADCFYCFTNLMCEIQDSFIEHFDFDRNAGVGKSMETFTTLLKKHDYELYLKLARLKVYPKYYAFRWLTLLFAQEFDLYDVLSLWDFLFSDPNRFMFIYYFALSMSMLQREQILKKDSYEIIEILHSYPRPDIPLNEIIAKAMALYSSDNQI